MANYYDGILGGIGLLLLGGAVTALLTVPTTVVVFAVMAMALIGHAMFVRPPTDTEETTENSSFSDGSPAPTAD